MKRIALSLVAAVRRRPARTLGYAGFKEPVVTYKDAVITGLGVSGGSLEVVLNVYNPNSFRLDGTARRTASPSTPCRSATGP